MKLEKPYFGSISGPFFGPKTFKQDFSQKGISRQF